MSYRQLSGTWLLRSVFPAEAGIFSRAGDNDVRPRESKIVPLLSLDSERYRMLTSQAGRSVSVRVFEIR